MNQASTSSDVAQNGWSQTTPVYMPWGSVVNPGQSGNSIIRFSGNPDECLVRKAPESRVPVLGSLDNNWGIPKPLKRKDYAFEDLTECPTRKQLITEEKIAAHMSRLQISRSESPHEQTASLSTARSQSMTVENANDSIADRLKIRSDSRLVLSEEFKNLRQQTCLPQALLEHMTKPSMAVVLWQPPRNILGELTSPSSGPRVRREAGPPPSPTRGHSNQVRQVQFSDLEDTNNNEAMDNLNATANDANDMDMEDQDL